MLDVPVSSGNHRSERAGTALFATSAMYNPNLDVHCLHLGSAWRMLDLLTSSGKHRVERTGTALPPYTAVSGCGTRK